MLTPFKIANASLKSEPAARCSAGQRTLFLMVAAIAGQQRLGAGMRLVSRSGARRRVADLNSFLFAERYRRRVKSSLNSSPSLSEESGLPTVRRHFELSSPMS